LQAKEGDLDSDKTPHALSMEQFKISDLPNLAYFYLLKARNYNNKFKYLDIL